MRAGAARQDAVGDQVAQGLAAGERAEPGEAGQLRPLGAGWPGRSVPSATCARTIAAACAYLGRSPGHDAARPADERDPGEAAGVPGGRATPGRSGSSRRSASVPDDEGGLLNAGGLGPPAGHQRAGRVAGGLGGAGHAAGVGGGAGGIPYPHDHPRVPIPACIATMAARPVTVICCANGRM